MQFIAFAGSNSSQSINLQLVKYTITFFENHSIDLLDLNDFEMPIYSLDREKNNGYPPLAHDFLQAIADSEGIIVSLAEHNRSYSAAFKNILDWCSRIEKKVFYNKPMLLMSASPGAYGGGNVSEHAAKFFPQFGAEIITTFKLPKFHDNFSNGIINEDLKNEHLEKIIQFKNHLGIQ